MEDAQGGPKFSVQAFGWRPFDHLKARTEEEEIKTVTTGGKPVDRATINMIERCQDQRSSLSQNRAFSVKEPCTKPWFNNIPVCFNYSIPCPEFRTELEDIPQEMSTAHAFLHFEDIHEVLNRSIVNL